MHYVQTCTKKFRNEHTNNENTITVKPPGSGHLADTLLQSVGIGENISEMKRKSPEVQHKKHLMIKSVQL